MFFIWTETVFEIKERSSEHQERLPNAAAPMTAAGDQLERSPTSTRRTNE
jgi:hypothetical protein